VDTDDIKVQYMIIHWNCTKNYDTVCNIYIYIYICVLYTLSEVYYNHLFVLERQVELGKFHYICVSMSTHVCLGLICNIIEGRERESKREEVLLYACICSIVVKDAICATTTKARTTHLALS
jgi:hypothetical protein